MYPWFVQAVCANVDSVIVGGVGDVVLHPGGGACINARCPAGTQAVGGGGSWAGIGSPAAIALDNSRPTAPDTWSLCGYAERADVHQWFVQAVCAPLETVIVGDVRDQAPHPGGGACITASCPAGMSVTGGGGYWSASGTPASIALDNSRPTDEDAWSICGFAGGGGSPEWFVQAICF